ncbi:hypothetical protein KAFR_0A02530 [Kazachstania africana CBS 2517]|uniref:Ribosomal RNA-processing protein 8 n=1 Tax=Kazachstania africana (strain ATCC 22294 / BCRC 22015 / CBS 2517 / CECT 1963 / NBRC 1671 / NRRL Y-8276) TaxID=1071382 RepID=H2AMT9_KAZAF|nr:hypothetical protein KAFR_0A02530 [Kazachstania africana CBS 2517]CCF55689.1 hypothetical protein KAFR_0A02530 [Kazachstania africana CBS 2517]
MELFKVEGWNLKTNQVAKEAKKLNPAKEKHKQKKKNAKKQRNEQVNAEDEQNSITNTTEKKITKRKKQKLASNVTSTAVKTESTAQPKKNLTLLQQKMLAKLTGSRFRWINEQLYTISSEDALKLISEQPQLFDEYHDGFRSQVQSWPANPVDVFIEQFKARSVKPINAPGGLPGLQKDKKLVIADMGCGEAELALKVDQFFRQRAKQRKNRKISYEIHSFDLKKANDRITVADIRHVPLEDQSCSVVIFCLSLMGTNFLDFIKEAYRILAPRGELWISEIKSRFSDGQGDEFVDSLKLLGFFHKKTDNDNKMFTRFEFFKPSQDIIEERKAKLERRQKFIEVETKKEELEKKRSKVAEGKWLLKPCIYKRR